MTRVLLADDQELLRRGLRGLLELSAAIEVVGEAGDGHAAVELARACEPDVLLLDVRMPELDGIGVMRALGDGCPPTVLLTTFDDPDALVRATAAGAGAFLLKDVALDTLVDVLVRVASGERFLGPVVHQPARDQLRGGGAEQLGGMAVDPLTPRETQVLALMARGLSNREIADALGTREGTVKNHTSSILSKLSVRDRTQAVLKALSLGWL
ncbi:MAG: response regulator transcription factor [Polyangiales bacterium]|nr:response regulator transcription factor [Myxococcales bacterium]